MALALVLLRNNCNNFVFTYIAPLRPLGSFLFVFLLGLGTPRIFPPFYPELSRDFFVGRIAHSRYIFIVVSS